ncbi:MAG: hypothetical protein IKW91_09065 [Bacteroidaceae bacterium]|nr:hypothetical protein [Bacteroidaceae bacterium]
MKKTLANLFILCAIALFCFGCGDDVPEPDNSGTTPNPDNIIKPTIDESSITYSATSKVVTFKASCPDGTKVRVLFRQLTNGTEEKLLDVSYNTSSRLYYTNLPVLVGGSTYAFCIIGYDKEGKEAVRTAERTFSLPKDAAPDAPSTANIKAYSPSAPNATDGYIRGDVISRAMEYSTDNGQTWKPVTVPGIISNLAPGNVLLRLAETPTTEAGKIATIAVPPYKSNTDIDGTDGTSEGLHIRRPSR